MLHSAQQKAVSRRALIFGGLQAAALSGLAARLYYLQFVKAEHLSIQAENNRVKLQLVPPMRGTIVDRQGELLAANNRNYQLLFDITAIKRQRVTALLKEIDELVGLDDGVEEHVLKGMKKRRFPPPFLLKEHMDWDMVATLKLHALDLPGTYIHTGQQRHYPLKDAGAHLLGYMGKVSEEDLESKKDPLLRLPDFKLGKNGIEYIYNEQLIGEPGIRQLEVNANGQVVDELQYTPSMVGEDMALTIDARLQRFIAERLSGQSASTVVMDIKSGDILAMVSMPGFDPDIFSRSIPVNYWDHLREDEKKPLLNKALQGQYPPGSTFKMVVGLAALEAGAITDKERIHCPGHYYLGNHRFNCWKPGGHGSVRLNQALAVSCDTYFYTLAERIGMDAIAAMARRLGFGDDFSLGFPGEKKGLVPSAAWKQASYNQPWQTGDTVNIGIGQGYMLATPLQLCCMTARLASTDYQVMPRLITDETFPKFAPLGIDVEHIRHIRAGMERAVNHQSGTAYGKRITEPGMEMAGKTGTSQVKKIIQRGQDQNTIPWKDRHHAFFVGYAPIHDPRYAVCVAVEHGGSGSAAAAPIARDVLEMAQQLEI